LPVDEQTKPSGWGTTLSKTHDVPKKSRAAREQKDKLFAILAEHKEFAELMHILRSIITNIHKSSQAHDHAKACSTVSGKPWNQPDAMVKTRWWSLFTFLDSFMFNIKTLHYMRDCPKHPMCHLSSTTSLTSSLAIISSVRAKPRKVS